MQIASKENGISILISIGLFVFGLVGGYSMTEYHPLTVIPGFAIIALVFCIIFYWKFTKPDNYIPIKELRIIPNPENQDEIKFEWDIENKSEQLVRVEKYRIKTKKNWNDHYYDVLIEPKETYKEGRYSYKNASYYRITTNEENQIKVILYYMAEDGKSGISTSETKIDLSNRA